MFQRICRTIGLQTSPVSAVTERTVRIDAHVLDGAAVHRTSLMDLVVRDDCSSHVPVQQENDRAVKGRMIP